MCVVMSHSLFRRLSKVARPDRDDMGVAVGARSSLKHGQQAEQPTMSKVRPIKPAVESPLVICTALRSRCDSLWMPQAAFCLTKNTPKSQSMEICFEPCLKVFKYILKCLQARLTTFHGVEGRIQLVVKVWNSLTISRCRVSLSIRPCCLRPSAKPYPDTPIKEI